MSNLRNIQVKLLQIHRSSMLQTIEIETYLPASSTSFHKSGVNGNARQVVELLKESLNMTVFAHCSVDLGVDTSKLVTEKHVPKAKPRN